jgi:hypothetical protein
LNIVRLPGVLSALIVPPRFSSCIFTINNPAKNIHQTQKNALVLFPGKVNACLPDERDEFYGLSKAYGEIQAVGWSSGRQAFTRGLKIC